MLETPDTLDQLDRLVSEFVEYKQRIYVQCDFFNCLVGIAIVIFCCWIFAYIINKES